MTVMGHIFYNWLSKSAFATALILLPLMHISDASAGNEPLLSPSSESLQLGEQMYRNGILPSGEPIQAFVKGDLPVPGTAFSCVSCHLRGGLGSVEGGVFTPPTSGLQLFQPFKILFKGLTQTFFPFPDRRPAYNDTTLAEVIRSGATPWGSTLNDVMPRYLLEDNDMAVLITYLKSLSARFPPGISDTTIHFASIITEDVSKEERDSMLAPLQRYINIKNSQVNSYKSSLGKKSRQMAENMMVSKELSTRKLTLSVWLLKGAQNTWHTQLEEYYRQEPVFALLGGISRSGWRPIHQFSEDNKIPCILPQTDFPVISDTDWYTLYPSKGYYQEGQAAARYLISTQEGKTDKKVVQIVRNSIEGAALSAGFEQTLRERNQPPVVTVQLQVGEKITSGFLQQIIKKENTETIILWDDTDVLTALESLSSITNKPKSVFVSARYLGDKLHKLPDNAREFTYITYPYSFAKAAVPSAMGGSILIEDESKTLVNLAQLPGHKPPETARQTSETITQLITMDLMEMRGNYYRDNFLDVLGMIPDQPSPTYARLSFGPGQRYASKGCYIVQLTRGESPVLVKKSAWVIH